MLTAEPCRLSTTLAPVTPFTAVLNVTRAGPVIEVGAVNVAHVTCRVAVAEVALTSTGTCESVVLPSPSCP